MLIEYDISNYNISITDELGNKGVFDQTEETKHYVERRAGGDLSGSGITVFKPSKIQTPFNGSIIYSYILYDYWTDNHVSSWTFMKSRWNTTSNIPPPPSYRLDATNIYTRFNAKLVETIKSSKELVTFYYENNSATTGMKKKLSRITVKSLFNNQRLHLYIWFLFQATMLKALNQNLT
ncbi:hypothetical protein [Marinifilum fragile]|uniref:hypothetical protein n=1 Tax=Marinifilum fragile TaxID=570161 RepID=UPI002AAAF5FF|nr:hypothetical protein [Marinifilum fragile]